MNWVPSDGDDARLAPEEVDTTYKIKVWLVFAVLVLVALMCSFLGFYIDKENPLLSRVLYSTSGSLFSTSAIGVAYTWFVRRETQKQTSLIVRTEMSKMEKHVADRIIKILLMDNDSLRQTLDSDVSGTIIRTALQSRFNDVQMADEFYDNFLSKIFSYEQRWSNYLHEITMESITDLSVDDRIRAEYYDVSLHLRCETVLRKTSFAFSCTSDLDTFYQLFNDPQHEYAWYISSIPRGLKIGSDFFKVLRVEVNGSTLHQASIVEAESTYQILYEGANLSTRLGKRVSIDYVLKSRMKKNGHYIFVTPPFPTRGVTIIFDYAKTDIKSVRPVTFHTSSTKVDRLLVPAEKPHRVEIRTDDWFFPGNGVVFVWRY